MNNQFVIYVDKETKNLGWLWPLFVPFYKQVFENEEYVNSVSGSNNISI